MTIKTIDKDLDGRTMTVVSEFDASIERVWRLWEDPRLLERWWGPPTYPATVAEHDFVPGGKVTYHMTGPEGDQHHGWWRIISVDPPSSLEFEDGFADESGEPNLDMPTMIMRVSLDEVSPGLTRMTSVTTFTSTESMQQVLDMGAEEGMKQSMGQMDALLAEAA